MRGNMFSIGPWWWWFFRFQGSVVRPDMWGYRLNPNRGNPVRSILFLWCELSWGRK